MKIGDKVRFLSDVGGGKVAGFKGKDIVLVEDEDGFQVPTHITEVVVVDNDDYSISRIVENTAKSQHKNANADDVEIEDYDPSERPITFKAPVEERKGGELLSAYLAFVPLDVQAITSSHFETYFINDSNYYMRFNYLTAEGAGWQLRSTTEVEPNTKVFIEEFGREELNDLSRVCVQIIAYKRNKPFLLKPIVETQIRIDAVKFYKLHTFQENDFFEQPALLYTIIDKDKQAKPLVVDADRLKMEMYNKSKADTATSGGPKPHDKPVDKNAPLVVDLHASELLETTAGLTPSDILNHQLETFRKTLNQYSKQKGKKIVFIHGKGEGVLRASIINELRYKFKGYSYQDASFREYGFGATQVTIR